MKKIIRNVMWVFYNLFLRFIPDVGPKQGIFKIPFIMRSWTLNFILASKGEKSNIGYDVVFTDPSNTKIGNRSGIGNHSKLGTVVIGDDCMIAEQCLLYSHNHRFNRTDVPIGEQGYYENAPVIIGNDVWVGGRVTILPGVKIGDGSIIGAGSVVTRNVDPYTIVGGNPAKVIRKR